MIYLSASAIKDFLSCSKKYYYRRYFSSLAEPTIDQIMGALTHEVIEKHWNNNKNAIEFAKNKIIEYNIGAKDSSTIQANIESFFENFAWLLHEDDIVEEFFKVKYAKDVMIVGKFDRITTDNFLIDWKAGRTKPNALRLQADPQFILYDWAYKQLYARRPSATYLASLSHGTLTTYVSNPTYENMLIYKIIPNILDAIRSERFQPDSFFTFDQASCYRCIYRETCHNELAGRNPTD